MTLAINNDGCRRESGHDGVLRVEGISFFRKDGMEAMGTDLWMAREGIN
jgi:hypothetical protein